MQSRLGSFVEVLVNTLIGMFLSYLTQLLVFPMFDIHIGTADNIYILLWFTAVSVTRSYVIRRWFNGGFRFKPELQSV